MQSRTTRRAVLTATALMAMTVATPAEAKPWPCDGGGSSYATGVVNVNKGYTLSVRARPRSDARKIGRLKDGRRIRIVCQTRGDVMTGRYGTSRVWDRLAGGGFVTDTYVYTGSDGRVAPPCKKRSGGGKGRPASVTMRDDYPFPHASWHEVDPWAFYKRECTSFVAFRLNKVMRFHNLMRGGRFSNAENWDENARRIGFRVNRRPRVGAVMVRNSGTFGHVAIVAKVRRGRILVEQYNAGGTHNYSREWLGVSSVMRFIHFPRR
jgi:surface antigen